MDINDICILVPIKTINKRLPGKTFRLLNGKPLYSYLFRTLSNLKGKIVGEIYVDSSDDEVLKIAQEYGFSTFKRPEEYNGDNIAGDQLIGRVIDSLHHKIIGLLHITSPFLSEETISKAIELTEKENVDSVFGVAPRYGRFWYKNAPVNHDPNNLVRTQDLIPVHEEAADLYFFKKDSFIKYNKRVCGNFNMIEVNKIECTDIDTLEDFINAEGLIKSGLIKTD